MSVTVARGTEAFCLLIQRQRFSDIAAGADLKYVPNVQSGGYRAVPLKELHPWGPGTTPTTATVSSVHCEDMRLDLASERPTFIYFWATWCGPCKAFIRELGKLDSDTFLQGTRVLGINLDRDCATFRDAYSRLRPLGEQYWDTGWRGELSQRFRIHRRGIPSGVWIGYDGNVVRITTGSDSLLVMLKEIAVKP
ncbi:MAG: TlpA family protein disulfide reductase [Candidatus Eisenbacteria sp.]|nr:TlpA family protein disulfide reductase [Candidatus Eisenbacteria bacterium]